MNSNVRKQRPPAGPTHDHQDEERGREDRSERDGRIAAVQLAAPPTRRWRRRQRLSRSR